MDDLTTAGLRLADHHAGPTPPVEAVRARVRRRARRRRTAAVLAAVAVAAGVAGAGLNLRGGGSRQVVVTGPPSPSRAVELPSVVHPAGWKPLDVGRLRVWAPTGTSTCGYDRSLTVSTGSACPSATPPLVVTRAVAVPRGATQTAINGVVVWQWRTGTGTSTTETDDVPSLGLRLQAHTALGRRIEATLGPSTLEALLTTAYPVRVPAGWRTVRFGGVRAEVPAAWPVEHVVAPPYQQAGHPDTGCTLFVRPVVYLGSVHGRCAGTASVGQPSALWLGTADSGTLPMSSVPVTTSAGIRVTFQLNPTGPSGTVDAVIATRSGSVKATIGVGRNPAVMEEVLSSLRAAG